MRKHVGLIMACVFVLSMVFPILSFADIPDTDLYTVGSDGSTIQKTTFGLDETPWLYMHLPDLGGSLAAEATWWTAPDSSSYYAGTAPSGNQDVWITPSGWDSVKQTGTWNIDALYFTSAGKLESGQANFTVTPEPVSVTLFLLGAGGMLLQRSKRKKLV